MQRMQLVRITSANSAAEGNASRVSIEAAGSALATATVTYDGPFRRLSFEVARGHLPLAARRKLVNAVFALPELAASCLVRAAIPIGDAELLAELRSRLADIGTRAAGATCLIDAIIGS